jgi:ATP-binding protein involved in chromosome partitioning
MLKPSASPRLPVEEVMSSLSSCYALPPMRLEAIGRFEAIERLEAIGRQGRNRHISGMTRLHIDWVRRVFKRMSVPSSASLKETLRSITDPQTGRDVVSAGLVESVDVRPGPHGVLVQASLLTDRAHAAAMEPVRQEAERVLAAQKGVQNATVVLTAHKVTASAPPAAPKGHGHAHGGAAPGRGAEKPVLLPQVRAIVAVASGKGGVGKSTVAVNLAVALARQGLRVGLLDADIYGPSLPRMLGLAGKPQVKGDLMIPPEAWGLKAMSIGFLVEEETPMIWRGPMVMGALEQMMGQVAWGELDIMIVDMPPGTGDAQLTMAQRVALTGAVIVSTPQDIALLDARRGVKMFERTRVPVLGLVENMSFFCCPNCGHRSEIFGHGGARAEAAKLGAEFLGEIPLLLDIRTAADAGTPIVASAPDSEGARAYAALAARLWEKVTGGAAKAGPRIVIS